MINLSLFVYFLIFLSICLNIECLKLDKKKFCKCRSGITGRIVGGKIVNDTSRYPWQATIGVLPDTPWDISNSYKKGNREDLPELVKLLSHFCGGTILNEQYILTAAHCIMDKYKIQRTVVTTAVGFGYDHKLTTIFDNQRYPVEAIYAHPFYPTLEDYDIALIKLKKKINFQVRNDVLPGCLPDSTKESLVQNIFTATGWGYKHKYLSDSDIDLNDYSKMFSNNLREAEFKRAKLNLRIYNFCSNTNFFCCKAANKKESVCSGDSGGPLHELINGRYRVVGITSLGFLDSKNYVCNDLSVFIKTSNFIEWIESIIGDNYCKI